ncbi:hypothetical protein KC711_08100 [Candidatus Peregrinibacteria bacterium]|nr:hypothetical protein [Candidatus Peregrinibacteria bacterium]MCB9805121.1 hypothetical protein [Candidatus Peribacteria bacterium]
MRIILKVHNGYDMCQNSQEVVMSWTIVLSLFAGILIGALIAWGVLKQKDTRLGQQPELRLKIFLRYRPFDLGVEKCHLESKTLESTSLRFSTDVDDMVHFPDLDIVLPARELDIEISIVDLNKK